MTCGWYQEAQNLRPDLWGEGPERHMDQEMHFRNSGAQIGQEMHYKRGVKRGDKKRPTLKILGATPP